MIYFQPGLYVTIEQLETELAPVPKPLNHGFNTETAYLVLGGFSLSESGEAFLVLSNGENEIWFISNRHLRTYDLRPASTAFRLPLCTSGGKSERNGHNGVPLEVAAVR
ncbi:MAG TPA: hypothetical protein VGI85_13465 [Chthoniobacterales bacterium]|jgi:hypothetical protein